MKKSMNTVYCSHIQGNMSTCAYSRTLFAIFSYIVPSFNEGVNGVNRLATKGVKNY